MSTKEITLAQLRDLHQNYLHQKEPLLSAAINKPETQSVWFELNDALRDNLNSILKGANVDGLRVYFIAYKSREENGFPEDAKDLEKMSVALVATERSSSGASIDSTNIPPLNHGNQQP
ncbi:MAG TPA: hypothetical protein PK872_02890 [Ferruginibacter sp.]|nr:hypothetical protein [Ferruginibacter sp.]